MAESVGYRGRLEGRPGILELNLPCMGAIGGTSGILGLNLAGIGGVGA